MSDWSEELKKMRKEMDTKLEDTRKKEEELRKKYESDIKEILDLIRSRCEPVVETYRDSSLKWEMEQPKFEMNESAKAAWLKMTIPFVTDLTIYFRLVLTDIGYSLKVEPEFYDTKEEKKFITTHNIPPPVKAEAIQNEIRSFLKEINDTIRRLEEKKRQTMR
jgi:hypothetical protein